MIEEVKLPEISENVDSGEVIKVLVGVGDTVEVDQGLVELETDKAAFEVPSTAAGEVTEILVEEGATVKVGDVIAKIETSGEGKATEKKTKKEDKEKEDKKEEAEEKEAEEKEEKEDEVEGADEEKGEQEEEPEEAEEEKAEPKARRKADSGQKPLTDTDRVATDPAPASPSVRRLARELGIDIHDVDGSGPGGRITSEDVHGYAKSIIRGRGGGGGVTPPVDAAARELPDFSKFGEVERESMSKIRRVTARNMAAAWNTVPHVTQNDVADITELEAARKRYGKKAEAAGGKLTMTAILIKVCASALKAFPDFNASIDAGADEIVYKKYVNIGVAVDTERGLLVPVIRDVDRKNIIELSVELNEVAEKARNRKITPDMLEGGNFTVSNLGGIGGTSFTPIVYHPEVAILGVSRATKRPVWRGEGFEPRLMLPLSLSYDHRLIDGAAAARFARWVAEALENPILLALEG